jgi:hypothetical protein
MKADIILASADLIASNLKHCSEYAAGRRLIGGVQKIPILATVVFKFK